MIYYLPDYEVAEDTLETAQDFLISLCEKDGEVVKPTIIWETQQDQWGDYENPKRVWRATPYVSVEGGAYIAPNHPDNGDDPEFDVELEEVCPVCDGKGKSGTPFFNAVTRAFDQNKCPTCSGTGRPAK